MSFPANHMTAAIEKATPVFGRTLECKQCHSQIDEDHTVAYHLLEGILYGWCESCFSKRGEANSSQAARTV